jgi:UDP-glucose 4-epimerase
MVATLVVGGSGFIGSEAVKMLSEKGQESISVDKIPSSNHCKNCKWVMGDILDFPSVNQILSEYTADTVLHFVGLPIVDTCEKNPSLSFLLNVVSVQNTLEAMRLHDIERIVFASSATVYGTSRSGPIKETDLAQPRTMYGYHKLIAEKIIESYAQSYGIDYVILRLFNVYGADPLTGKEVVSIFIRKALAGEPLIVKGSQKFRDFIRVDEVAHAFLRARDNNGSNLVLNIGSGTKTSLGIVAGIVKDYFPEVEIREETASDDGTGLQADIGLAKQILDFEPPPPQIGIREHICKYVKTRNVR